MGYAIEPQVSDVTSPDPFTKGASVQSPQVSSHILNFRRGKALGEATRHERLMLIDTNFSQSILIKKVALTGDIHNLQRISVLIATNTTDFTTTSSLDDHNTRAALIARIQDLVPQ